MGWTFQIKTRQALLSVLVTISMVFGQFFIGPVLTSDAALNGDTDFEIGLPDEVLGTGTESDDIVTANNGGIDWLDLQAAGAVFDELEVEVINDQNFTGDPIVFNPETAATTHCVQDNDLIVKGGTKIDDFPFPTVEGSPSPGKNDICQVYISYEFVGGDTIAYIGVVRRETGGTTAVAVELNKVSHSDRQVADLLIMFEFDGSGPVSSLAVRSWNGSTWGDPVPLAANEWGGTSWEFFGEVAVNLSTTGLLPPPVSVDDCDSFSSIAPYGVAGNSNNSNVGDWGGESPIDIPRCGSIEITKIATPAADSGYEFHWELSDNTAGQDALDSATGILVHNETTTFDIVGNDVFTLTETSADAPYVLDRIECVDDLGVPVAPDAISVDIGETVSCTIYNEASAVQVVKAGQGDPTADFDFSITSNDDFQLSLGDSSSTYLYLPGSTVTVDEDLPGSAPAWSLTGISCIGSESGDVSPTVDLSEGTATFGTLAGETITCTYTNAQDALLTLEKEVINLDGGQALDTAWTLHADGPDNIQGSEGDLSVTNANVSVGSYDLSETNGPDGYTMVGWDCGAHGMDDTDTVTLTAGDIVTCTVTNDDDPGTLTLLKKVSPTNGGSANDAAWTLNAVGPTPGITGSEGAAAVTNVSVTAGDYILSESGGPFGWIQQGEWACGDAPYSADTDTVTVGLGENVTCEVTNTDIAPTLTLVKDLTATYGGDASELDFLLTAATTGLTLDGVNGKDEPGPNDGGPQDVINEAVIVGSYTLSETSPPGYTQVGAWSCIGGDFTSPNQIDLGPGESATCTVTNIDLQPTIKVLKDVSNDHGGQLGVADFPLYIDSNLVTHNVAQGVLSNTEYVVSEDLTGIVGYQQVGPVSCSIDGGDDFDLVGGAITLNEGEDAVCTIFNEDLPSTLTLLKDVITDDGGLAADTDFTLNADGPDSISGVEGDASVSDAEVLPGDYDLSESGPDGYAQLGGWDCGEAIMVDGDTVSIALGEEVTCEVTNDDIAPGLTVVKLVVNDDGGTAVPGDFQLYLNGDAVDQGVAQDVLPGVAYTVTEDSVFGYTNLGVECFDSDGMVDHPVTLSEGDAVLCTITNDDIAPRLTLEKVVINDGGGEAVDTDWTLHADGPDSISGVEGDASITDAAVEAGDYTLSESGPNGYAQLGDWDCGEAAVAGGDTVALGVGDIVTCTVTNDQLDADLAITKDDLVDPISLDTDNPVGEIEYVVSVTNLGPAVAKDVVVTDTLPASLTFVSATPSVGSCAHAAGIVTCGLGDMAVGDLVTIAIVTETEALGEVTDLIPQNVVEVSSTTPDPDLSNNVDNEVTEIIEVEDIIILPFTGVYGDFWFMMALLLISSGALVLFMSRILKDSDQANYPG